MCRASLPHGNISINIFWLTWLRFQSPRTPLDSGNVSGVSGADIPLTISSYSALVSGADLPSPHGALHDTLSDDDQMVFFFVKFGFNLHFFYHIFIKVFIFCHIRVVISCISLIKILK